MCRLFYLLFRGSFPLYCGVSKLWQGVRFVAVSGVFALLATSYSPAADPPVRFVHISTVRGGLPVPFPGTQQTACVVGDIIPGGPKEWVVAERTRTPSVVWYRYRDGGFERFVIEPEALRIEAGGVLFDVDLDGDDDLVLGEDASGDRVYWWENPGPARTDQPWRRRLVKDGGGRKHHDQAAADFDGDGRYELAFWNQGARALCIAPIPRDPRATEPWPYRVVYRWKPGEREHEGLTAADVDRDGRIDLVGAGLWFRSRGKQGFEVRDVAPDSRFTRALAADVVPRGYLELIFVPGDADGPCVLYAWTGKAWVGRVLEQHVTHGHTLQGGDVDRDGDVDVLVAEMGRWGRNQTNPDARMLLFLNRGDGTFDRYVLARGTGNHESKLADVDGNGWLDIVGKPYNWMTPRLDLWLNYGPIGGAIRLRKPERLAGSARVWLAAQEGATVQKDNGAGKRQRIVRWAALSLMALTLILVVFVGALLLLWILRWGNVLSRRPTEWKEPLHDIWFENDPRRQTRTNGGSETS